MIRVLRTSLIVVILAAGLVIAGGCARGTQPAVDSPTWMYLPDKPEPSKPQAAPTPAPRSEEARLGIPIPKAKASLPPYFTFYGM